MSIDPRILELLSEGPRTTSELCSIIGCTQSRAYLRCKKLEAYGFVRSERAGDAIGIPIVWRLAR